jgi:two-component system invasion response regulator UvrY
VKELSHILIADDHDVVRLGVKAILQDRFENLTVEESLNFRDVLDKVDQKSWDLLILDINMPKGNILDVLQHIQIDHPEIPILILSMYPEEEYAVQMLKAGASGYITKESVTEELIPAVQQIQSGKKFISPSLAEKIADSFTNTSKSPNHEVLSSREFQILLHIASGKSLKKIAEELCLSDRTVSTYRSRILEKMNLQSNSDLIQYAIHHHLIDHKLNT